MQKLPICMKTPQKPKEVQQVPVHEFVEVFDMFRTYLHALRIIHKIHNSDKTVLKSEVEKVCHDLTRNTQRIRVDFTWKLLAGTEALHRVQKQLQSRLECSADANGNIEHSNNILGR